MKSLLNKTKLNRLQKNNQDLFGKKTQQILDTFLKCMDDIETVFGKLLHHKNSRLIITNVGRQNSKDQGIYSLIIDRDSIIFAEKNQSKKSKFKFNLHTFTLTVNDQDNRLESMELLLKKIQFVIDELQQKRASIFHTKI